MDRSTAVERSTTERADTALAHPEAGAPLGDVLDGLPHQRAGHRTASAPALASAPVPARAPGRDAPTATATEPAVAEAAVDGAGAPVRAPRLWELRELFPTPAGTPFTFTYAVVLAAVSVAAAHADPSLVHALHQGSSTDVAHLAVHPMLVLIASALWIAGGITSPYAIGFLLVLTALERRTGGLRAVGVFLLGHMAATLATEVPVGIAVLAGHLPGSSLHRLDYGISFGVATSVGALAGLLSPWLRLPLLTGFGAMLVADLIAFTDPMTEWGHLMALAVGIATWPLVRRARAARAASEAPVPPAPALA
ncbi:rhomboid-like protein [Streptomyces sp. Tue6028]|uniref:rhomboid-like protein n=1 Tax=Streptomyces sp. Tue6028 TaxID=2036037 RepID=UPI003D724AC0